MATTKFVGIAGKKYTGKNTFAEMLKKEMEDDGVKVAITGFANPLKLSVYRLFTGDMEASEEEAVKWVDDRKGSFGVSTYTEKFDVDVDLTFRQFLQRYGTESHRQTFEDDFWITQTLNGEKWSSYDFVLVADVRFENEAEAILDLGGPVFCMKRDTPEDGDQHASEKELSNHFVDMYVNNQGNMDQLQASANVLAEDIIMGRFR